MISYHNRKWKGFQLAPPNNPSPSLPQLSGERTLVALATYNEAENIVPILNQIRNVLPKAMILVIDDNSPDGTASQVEKQMASDSSIHLIRRAGKLGLGTALLRAVDYSKQIGAQYLVILDADLSHPVSAMPRLLEGMVDHDVMIGSRYVAGGGTRGWPLSRQIISRGVNLLFQGLFRVPVKDASGSYRCYSVSLLASTRTDKLISTGYSFLEELLYLCVKAGARVGESPIVFVERAKGASKVNWMEAARSLSTLLFLGVRSTLGWDDELKPSTKY